MRSVRQRFESWFERLAVFVYRHKWASVAAMVAITVPLLLQIPKITIDTRTESFFLEGDPAIQEYNKFRDQFGMDEFVVVAINPPEVFDLEFLDRLKELHEELEEKVPLVAEVSSLINARNTRGEGDTLIVEELLEHWPENEEQLAALRARVLANPLYVNRLISKDGTFTTVVVRPVSVAPAAEQDVLAGFEEPDESASGAHDGAFLTSAQNADIVDSIYSVVRDHESSEFPIYVAGGPVVTTALNRAVPADIAKLMPMATVLIAIILFLLFRRTSGVVYPLMIVFLSLLSTLGVMGAAGIPMTNITSVLASFLLVVGIADAVHILTIYYRSFDGGGDRCAAIATALGHSGLAVLMTSVTTSTGLLSFLAADVKPVADLGIIAPVGIGFALLYTLVLLPALIAIVPTKRRTEVASSGPSVMDRLLAGVARVSCERSRTMLVIGLAVVLVSVAGMTRLRFSQNGLKWFKKTAEIRQAAEAIDRELRGSLTFEVVIDTGTVNGLYEPDFLNRLDRAVAYLGQIERGDVYVGNALSLDTVLKEVHRALNENRPEFYAIPQDRELVAQELLLFEGSGSDDLEELVDSDFSTVRLTLTVPFRDAFEYVPFSRELEEYLDTSFPDARFTITGSNALYVKMFHNIITTMAKSYVISLSVITVLMMILIGRVRIGMLSMVPNLLPLVVVLGIMGWLDIVLDMNTVLIGSIAIGLVVDDTIHFMHNFRRYFEQTGEIEQAVELTLNTAGRAILVTSIVLAGGFYAGLVSELASSVLYSGLMGTTVIVALVADFYITPALMKTVHRQWEAGRPGPNGGSGSKEAI